MTGDFTDDEWSALLTDASERNKAANDAARQRKRQQQRRGR